MELRKALEEKKYDLRIRDRLVAEGKIQGQELERYYGQLSDDESHIRPGTGADAREHTSSQKSES